MPWRQASGGVDVCTQWRPIWDEIKQISGEFKNVRYPTRVARQAAWDRFQSLVQRVKQRQAADRREFDSRASASAERKEHILQAARDATPICLLTDDILGILESIVNIGVDAMTLGALPGGHTDDRLETLQYCSRRIKEGWALLEESKREMLGRDKAECFQALKDAQESLDAAWQQWKSWQSDQRQRRMEQRREKREEFEERVRSRIADLNERREHLYGVLAHKERHLDELHEKLASARSDDFRARVAGWIDEEQDRISEIKTKLDDIEGWIDEEKEKLR
ncbi:MAG: hypothetical protein ACT4O2_15950 [Beijerinckiaceae bacterium]